MLPLAIDKVQNVGVEAAPCGLGILHQLLVRGIIHPEVYRFHAGEDMDSPAVVPNVKFWSPCWMVPKWDYICRVINEQRNAMNATHTFAAQVMGTAAFHAGIKSAPVLDKQFMDYFRELTIAGVIGEVGSGVPLFDAWLKAWHMANVEAAA